MNQQRTVTLADVIALMNRRIAAADRRAHESHTQRQIDRATGSRREIAYILGRITAQQNGIRSIHIAGD